MNISQMTNDQASDAMIRISAALGFICEDEEVKALMKDFSEAEDSTLMQNISAFLPRVTALAFRKHRDSLYEIIGALSQKDKKAVGKMNFVESVNLLRENLQVLLDFFPSSGTSTRMTEQPSA